MVQECLIVAVVAVEVAADLAFVLLEERADHLGEVAEQYAINLILSIEDAEKIVQIFFV